MGFSVNFTGMDNLADRVLFPARVKFAVYVAVLVAVAVAGTVLFPLVVSVAGVAEAFMTLTVYGVVAWFATAPIRHWFPRYARYRSWVQSRAFTFAFPYVAERVETFPHDAKVAREFMNV